MKQLKAKEFPNERKLVEFVNVNNIQREDIFSIVGTNILFLFYYE
jgi:hypothetical protein